MERIKEHRSQSGKISYRKAGDEIFIEGYAMVFNTPSQDLGGFKEVILPESIDETIIKSSDIFCYINHNENTGVLARSRYGVGSLKLTIDDVGLKYSFKLGKSYHHQQLLEYIERGEIFGSSFAFTVLEDEILKGEDGTYIRYIKRFDRLYDVSPVFEPAYLATDVSVRSRVEKIKNDENSRMQRLKELYVELENKYRYE